MGIKERQGRNRETVRRAILDAARELFVAESYANVSIRKIAERIEYSPAAIYGYFASKDDIFFELAEEGFRLLACIDESSAEQLERLDPLQCVRASFWRMYEFSREHPQYFSLMFIDRSVPRITREYERFAFARERRDQLIGRIQKCIDAGVFPAAISPTVAFRLMTMALVGVIVMRMSDRLPGVEDADRLAQDVLDVTIAGLQSGIPLRSAAGCPMLGREGTGQPAEAAGAREAIRQGGIVE